jgi:hypothetical protein
MKNFLSGLRRARRASENLNPARAKSEISTHTYTHTHTHKHAATHGSNTSTQQQQHIHRSQLSAQETSHSDTRLTQPVGLHRAAWLNCEQQQQQPAAALHSRAPARAPAAYSSRAGGAVPRHRRRRPRSRCFLLLLSLVLLALLLALTFSLSHPFLPSSSSYLPSSVCLLARFSQFPLLLRLVLASPPSSSPTCSCLRGLRPVRSGGM